MGVKTKTAMPTSTLPTPHAPLLAWHGLALSLPDDWSPVKIDGDALKGSIIIADLHASRLAVRWQTIKRPERFDADAWARSAIAAEVGQLMLEQSKPLMPDAADEWSGGRLFVEPEPPGRDVWVGFHRPTSRAVEIVHQTKRRSHTLAEIVASARGAENAWSIFDLSCRVPAGWTLTRQRLNAGDLTLTFGKGRETLIVRQLAPATLALARQPIGQWIETHARLWNKTYAGRLATETIADGSAKTFERRRRFFFARWLAPQRTIVASIDPARDRLVIVDAPTRALADEVRNTVPLSPRERD